LPLFSPDKQGPLTRVYIYDLDNCGKNHKFQNMMLSATDDLRILIVADDPLVRASLAATLASQTGFTVIGQIAADKSQLAQLNVHRPDVVLWDLGLEPTLSLKHLVELTNVGFPIVALLPDESYAAQAWTENIRGLLLREMDAASLAAALRAVAQDLVVLDPVLAPTLVPYQHAEEMPLVEALTPRELEVLQLLAEGLANKVIAQRLKISEHTVKFHVNAILGKLNANSRTDAVVRATRLGLIIL
jgi:DNA-binding NarL/FixJ family response regulator